MVIFNGAPDLNRKFLEVKTAEIFYTQSSFFIKIIKKGKKL